MDEVYQNTKELWILHKQGDGEMTIASI